MVKAYHLKILFTKRIRYCTRHLSLTLIDPSNRKLASRCLSDQIPLFALPTSTEKDFPSHLRGITTEALALDSEACAVKEAQRGLGVLYRCGVRYINGSAYPSLKLFKLLPSQYAPESSLSVLYVLPLSGADAIQSHSQIISGQERASTSANKDATSAVTDSPRRTRNCRGLVELHSTTTSTLGCADSEGAIGVPDTSEVAPQVVMMVSTKRYDSREADRIMVPIRSHVRLLYTLSVFHGGQ
ncbi:hypothetical protein C8R43DRAFT_1130827 [Mycena crocata]|nr:hypothetical protein C8R43DRAFT_1130827 [Mycena crocata]